MQVKTSEGRGCGRGRIFFSFLYLLQEQSLNEPYIDAKQLHQGL